VFRINLLMLISSAALVVAAPQPQPFRRPLVFDPNRGQAPAPVKWQVSESTRLRQLSPD
jgi:hypothetical protein